MTNTRVRKYSMHWKIIPYDWFVWCFLECGAFFLADVFVCFSYAVILYKVIWLRKMFTSSCLSYTLVVYICWWKMRQRYLNIKKENKKFNFIVSRLKKNGEIKERNPKWSTNSKSHCLVFTWIMFIAFHCQ